MELDLKWDAPRYTIWFAAGFAAYYLRYGNAWQGNEIRLVYNILFGTLNLIGWCLEWLWYAGYFYYIGIVVGAFCLVTVFLWICHLPPFKRQFRF